MELSEALKKRIYELLNENNMNVTNLCLQSNLTPSTLFDFLYGKTKIITISTLAKLCDGFGMTLEEFFAKDYLKTFTDTYE